MMRMAAFAAALVAAAAFAAAPERVRARNGGFEEPPRRAIEALRIAQGKSIPSGMVFINGELVKGPYVISRHGTVIMVNRMQATGQIVPWRQFTTAAASPRKTAAPSAPAANPPAPSSATADAGRNAAALSADDLFEDDAPAAPAPKRTAPPPRPAPAAASRGDAGAQAGEYEDSPRTKALLKRINDFRTNIDRTLRENGMYFFSSSHAPVRIDPRTAKQLADTLPVILRGTENVRALSAELRRRGIAGVPDEVCADLLADKAMFVKIRDRANEIKEELALRKILEANGSRR